MVLKAVIQVVKILENIRLNPALVEYLTGITPQPPPPQSRGTTPPHLQHQPHATEGRVFPPQGLPHSRAPPTEMEEDTILPVPPHPPPPTGQGQEEGQQG